MTYQYPGHRPSKSILLCSGWGSKLGIGNPRGNVTYDLIENIVNERSDTIVNKQSF